MAKIQGRIKADSKSGSHRLRAEEPPDCNTMVPIFSLERVQNGEYCFSKLDRDGKAAFAESVFKRRSLTWNDIQKIDRHGLGFEKIAVSGIKASVPKFITEDQHNLLAFRFSGKCPMVGYRVKNIFYVLWFDHKFTLYEH
jgi:hypothetical protein